MDETPGVEAVWSDVPNLSKTSGMHIKSFINVSYTILIYLFFFHFLVVYPCFAFRKYTGASKFMDLR
jgi:hypothetical protein